MRWLWVILGLVLSLPATATALTLGPIAPPAGPIPVDGSVEVMVPWTIDCQDVAPDDPFSTVVLTFDPPRAEPPTGLSVVGSLSQKADASACRTSPTGQVKGQSPFMVVASSKAPGQVPITIHFSVKTAASGPTGIYPERHATANTTVEVAFRGLVTVWITSSIQQVTPGNAAEFPIRMTNLGNAAERIQVMPVGDLPTGWHVRLPDPPLLDGAPVNSGDGPDAMPDVPAATIRVEPPKHMGWNNDEAALRFQLVPVSAKHGNQTGETRIVSLLVRERGWSFTGSPNAGVLVTALVVAAVATGVVVMRRRRP